jgi:hypothetical protein
MDDAMKLQWERTWNITAIEATGALGVSLDDRLLLVRWMIGWATREQLQPCLHDPQEATAYLQEIRQSLTCWIDWCDSTIRLVGAWGMGATHTGQQQVLTQWRTQFVAMLTALEQWDGAAAVLPCLGWHLGHAGGDDGAI